MIIEEVIRTISISSLLVKIDCYANAKVYDLKGNLLGRLNLCGRGNHLTDDINKVSPIYEDEHGIKKVKLDWLIIKALISNEYEVEIAELFGKEYSPLIRAALAAPREYYIANAGQKLSRAILNFKDRLEKAINLKIEGSILEGKRGGIAGGRYYVNLRAELV